MNFKQVKNIDAALRIYYTYSEIGTAEMKELFGKIGSDTITKHKNAVKDVQIERGVMTSGRGTVNTEIAYEVWGIDVNKLERNRKKLKELGLMT